MSTYDIRTEDHVAVELFAEGLRRAKHIEVKADKAVIAFGRSLGLLLLIHNSIDDSYWSPYYSPAAGDRCIRNLLSWLIEDKITDMELNNDPRYIFDWESIQKSYAYWGGDFPGLAFAVCPCEKCQAALDPDFWIESLVDVSDWSEVDWTRYDYIPAVY